MNLLIIGLVTIASIICLSSLDWRLSVKAVLVLLVIEGALRKWVLPQASDAMYFLKDVVLFGAYLKYYVFSASERKYQIKSDILKLLVFLAAGWSLFQAFNPSLGSAVVGMFGFKNYIYYIPLMWMIPNLFQSEEELYKFLRIYLLLVIPIGFLGIAQFFSPYSSLLNVYTPGAVSDVATFGVTDAARITGTFSYLSGYSLYLLVCFGLLVPMLSIKQPLWWRWLSVIELLLVVVNSMMTGSRTSIFAEVLFLLGYLCIQGLTRPVGTLSLLNKFLVPVVVVSLAASIWFRPALDAIWLRTTANKDVTGRISSSFVEPLQFIKYKELDGYGTGATHQGSVALRRILSLPEGEYIPVYYESEMGRVALELGPIGFVFWYGLRVGIAIALWLVFWKLKRPFLRQLALAAFLIQTIQLSGHLVFHHTFAVHYWFLSSFVFLLPRLEQVENWYREQQILQQDVSYTYLPDSSYE